MDLRRIAYAAASTRPLLSVCRNVRQFTTSVPRLVDDPAKPSSSPSSTSFAELSKPAPQVQPLAGGFSDDIWDIFTTTHTPAARKDFKSRRNPNSPPISHVGRELPKMGPTAGRSIVVFTDVAQAFMKLRSVISQNKVRQDWNRQRFHERAGSKRKRLKSERHRRRFKEGFKRMVRVVLDMKKKGM